MIYICIIYIPALLYVCVCANNCCFISVLLFKLRQIVDASTLSINKQQQWGQSLIHWPTKVLAQTLLRLLHSTRTLPSLQHLLPFPLQWSDNLQPCLLAKFNPRQFLHCFLQFFRFYFLLFWLHIFVPHAIFISHIFLSLLLQHFFIILQA